MGLGVLMPILIIALRHLTKDEYPDPSLAVYLWPPSFLMVFGGWFTLLLSMILNTLLYALIGYLAAFSGFLIQKAWTGSRIIKNSCV